MKKNSESIFLKYLVSLDSIWTKLITIGVIFCAGFKGGCYWQETKMRAVQNTIDKGEWLKTAHYIDSLRNINYDLKKENAELLYNVERLSNQLKNGEK